MLSRISLITVILFAHALVPAHAASRLPDAGQEGLSGPVRTVETTIERTIDGKPVLEKRETLTYATSGDLVERLVYSGGAVSATLTYSYDAAGVRHITSTTLDGVGNELPSTRLKPSVNPAVAAASRTADGRFAFSATYTYTAGGRIIDERLYAGTDASRSAVPLTWSATRFGAIGLAIERQVFSGSPERRVSRETFTYGDDGRVSESFRYGPGNVLPIKTTYTYKDDAHGNWVERTEAVTIAGQPVVTVRRRTITYFDSSAPAKQ